MGKCYDEKGGGGRDRGSFIGLYKVWKRKRRRRWRGWGGKEVGSGYRDVLGNVPQMCMYCIRNGMHGLGNERQVICIRLHIRRSGYIDTYKE